MSYNVKAIIQPIIDRIQKIAAQRIADASTPPPIIGIAGGPGAGKSYFSQTLKKMLEQDDYHIQIVEQDNFLLYNETHFEVKTDINPRLKWTQINQVLDEINKNKSQIRLPFRNKTVRPFTTEYQTIDFSCIDIVLFDGKHALSGPETFNFFAHCALGIFLETNEKNMREWKIKREELRSKTIQKEPHLFEKKLAWGMEIYEKYILPTKKNATFVINVDEKHHYTLMKEPK